MSNTDPIRRESVRPGGRITLHVQDESGRPLSGTMVELSEAGTECPALGMVADAAGHFAWSVSPGTYRISAHAADHQSRTTQITVMTLDPITVTLRLPAVP